MKKIWLRIKSRWQDMESHDTDWAKRLGPYELDWQKMDRALYGELLNSIRQAADGAFDVGSAAVCRPLQKIAICQKKDLPWDYLYDCIKWSRKDFCILLPPCISDQFLGYVKEDGKPVYAWYEPEADGIRVLAYTGVVEEEEDTSPGYDGYGRFDTDYEVVQGIVNREGNWIREPYLRFVSLYGVGLNS